ncbi:GGDEF domain-containing response regulator [Vibrio agarivorans]|uniref:diguanylate cyclase n=1 Tax=Vibrio agarivorans TaxID=153622 RepID=A0ABT7XXG4_9VIBR|nr:diguanylate cyclase [Vibrio agarivorans]
MMHQVLVVEDSRAYQNYLSQQLRQAGFDVICADSLLQAKEIIAEQPQLLCAILDYCLPDAQDGEVIDWVLQHQYRVIVLTATFNENVRESVLAKGVVDYILKDSMASVSYLLPLVHRLRNNHNHKALVVDDSLTVRNHITYLLNQQYITTIEAENGQQALELFEQHSDISIIITDHDMPIKDGISMIRELRTTHNPSQLAILGLSGSDDRTMTAQFLKAGANDFLYKPFNQEELFCRIHHLLEMKEAHLEMYRLANQDALTGLWNRRYLFNQSCPSSCSARSVAMLDIDFFKKVNDNYGHDAGDSAIRTIANILKIYFPDDVVARFGGEEFCVQSCAPYEEFTQRLESVRCRVEKTPVVHGDLKIPLTISIGSSQDKGSLEQQIKLADERLYQAKESGRNRLICTP